MRASDIQVAQRALTQIDLLKRLISLVNSGALCQLTIGDDQTNLQLVHDTPLKNALATHLANRAADLLDDLKKMGVEP